MCRRILAATLIALMLTAASTLAAPGSAERANMSSDRFFVIFSDPKDISAFIQPGC